jgi:hypothetical protein
MYQIVCGKEGRIAQSKFKPHNPQLQSDANLRFTPGGATELQNVR